MLKLKTKKSLSLIFSFVAIVLMSSLQSWGIDEINIDNQTRIYTIRVENIQGSIVQNSYPSADVAPGKSLLGWRPFDYAYIKENALGWLIVEIAKVGRKDRAITFSYEGTNSFQDWEPFPGSGNPAINMKLKALPKKGDVQPWSLIVTDSDSK